MTAREDKLPLVMEIELTTMLKSAKGDKMTNALDSRKAHTEDECRHYSWLEDYLEGLEGKEAFREFQEHCHDTPEYYTVVASLLA